MVLMQEGRFATTRGPPCRHSWTALLHATDRSCCCIFHIDRCAATFRRRFERVLQPFAEWFRVQGSGWRRSVFLLGFFRTSTRFLIAAQRRYVPASPSASLCRRTCPHHDRGHRSAEMHPAACKCRFLRVSPRTTVSAYPPHGTQQTSSQGLIACDR